MILRYGSGKKKKKKQFGRKGIGKGIRENPSVIEILPVCFRNQELRVRQYLKWWGN